MTKAEAIKVLKGYMSELEPRAKNNICSEEFKLYMAISIAVEKLEQPEIVHCKDCTKCEVYEVDTGEDCMTGLWCGIHQKDTTPQAFCSYGEREGGDDE